MLTTNSKVINYSLLSVSCPFNLPFTFPYFLFSSPCFLPSLFLDIKVYFKIIFNKRKVFLKTGTGKKLLKTTVNRDRKEHQ